MQINVEQINAWRHAQRAQLTALYSLPVVQSTASTSLGQRVLALVGAAFGLLFPIGAVYYIAPIIRIAISHQGGRILAYLLVGGVVLGLWREGLRALRDAFAARTEADTYWLMALKLASSGETSDAMRFAAEAMTYPWNGGISPRLSTAEIVWSRRGPETTENASLLRSFVDLFIVEILLEAWLRPEGTLNQGRTLSPQISAMAFDSDALLEFSKMIRQMAENQRPTSGELPLLVNNLAILLAVRSPRAASALDGKERAPAQSGQSSVPPPKPPSRLLKAIDRAMILFAVLILVVIVGSCAYNLVTKSSTPSSGPKIE